MAGPVATWFQSLPIRRKLVVTTAVATSSALLLAAGGFLVWDVVDFRYLIEYDVAAQARVLSENTAPALVFNDERAAGETIAALELRPRVVMGCVYGIDGRLVAAYHRSPAGACPRVPPPQTRLGWNDAEIVSPVTYGGSRVGTLFILRDFADVHGRMAVGLVTVAGLIVLCTLVALGLGALLQRSIVEPMLQLAHAARAVSKDEQLERRVVPVSSDEVSVVVHAFNDMLDRIAERTAALSRANTDLQHEIEERKRMETERTTLLARERDANRLKDEFLATLSHELRTPLNAVLGWARVLRSTAMPPDTQARALESIERNARVQARLVEDLLEVSRIVTGKLRLDVRPTDLAAILDEAIHVIKPAAAAKRIRLHVDIGARPAMTSADPDRLQQVVWNLLSNAVKFTPAGGEVSVALRRNDGFTMTVRDSGVGIAAELLPHIFEPFRQGDGSSSREHGGLGLGLAIVRRIIEMHGGTVKAASRGAGEGATFEVYLPSELPAHDAATQIDTLPHHLPAGAPDGRVLRGIRVLAVDDEDDALELMHTTFAAYGAIVFCARSADEAIQIFDRAAPDVLVSDIGMPFEDGYALIKRVRRRAPAQGGLVPAVALTAYALPGDRLTALAAGYQAHVTKPYEPSEVVALVERLAKGATAR